MKLMKNSNICFCFIFLSYSFMISFRKGNSFGGVIALMYKPCYSTTFGSHFERMFINIWASGSAINLLQTSKLEKKLKNQAWFLKKIITRVSVFKIKCIFHFVRINFVEKFWQHSNEYWALFYSQNYGTSRWSGRRKKFFIYVKTTFQ